MKKLAFSMIMSAIGLYAHGQGRVQDTRIPDRRIYFHPDEPSPKVLIKGELALWPNPAMNSTRISVKDMPDAIVGKDYMMTVYNTAGDRVQISPWSAGHKLDVSSFPEGMYIVTIQRGELLFSQKLIVKRD